MSNPSAKLLDYLPEIYRDQPFLDAFLAAFETVLIGRPNNTDLPAKGLENTLDRLDRLFDPITTPDDFLPWLTSWTALSLRADLEITQQRQFIANIIPLYQRRGTKENLRQLLEIFTQGKPEVIETGTSEFQIGVNSTVGVNTILGGGVPHFFQVIINLPRIPNATLRNRQIEIARALIELEKPAHTNYSLETRSPTLQINVHSTIGVDTILGTQTSA